MSLQPNELRIGNHITDVWASPGCAFEVISFNIRTVKYGARFVCKWKDTLPVTLTSDILLKCGFTEREHRSDWFIKLRDSNTILIINLRRNSAYICEPNQQANFFITCQYIHQLQNLYFALTGEELTFNQK